MHKPVIKVALLGLGTIGGGVYKVLNKNSEIIKQRINSKIEVAKVLEKNISRCLELGVNKDLIANNIDEIVNDQEIDIVIELMGGIEPAREFVLKALNNGKSVVTANKDMIALHGKELYAAAEDNNVDLLFEASVGGGIPIIRPLKQCLAANHIQEVMGIVNGTTNYMLEKMSNEGLDFDVVLKEAQDKGYAEANPSSDIEGFDAARKVAILASIAFNTRITVNEVYVEGISRITAEDISYASELHYVVKLLGIAKETEEGIEVRVHPVFIPKQHPLASVGDVFNAIFVRGDAVGDTMFYGRGAGELPTASAVVADVMDAARRLNNNVQGLISCTCFEDKPVKPIGKIFSKYYIRLQVADRPGVLASIAFEFGKHEVSLASVLQKHTLGDSAEIVLITHKVQEQNLRDSLEKLQLLDTVHEVSNVIRVEDEEEII
ncbi:homoserine dehydrogenase [Desulfolucanica intricata]|uniref:homoserine dehydrogenase n=1 Tax=Desulfolucanica intricata TaxID=1285191 RepID=UPI00082E44B2|nr:homoserine dehydrogenase [Desulfolucanica intricata]